VLIVKTDHLLQQMVSKSSSPRPHGPSLSPGPSPHNLSPSPRASPHGSSPSPKMWTLVRLVYTVRLQYYITAK